MPIDITKEELVTFKELARSLPRRRKNRPVHYATIHRWRSRGLKGIRLEAVRVGGAWHTSWEAFRRFCDRLTAVESQAELPSAKQGRGASHQNAEKSLDAEGW